MKPRRMCLPILAVLLVASLPVVAQDQPVTLARVLKKGDTARYRAESKITTSQGNAELEGTSKTTVIEVKENGSVVLEEVAEGGKLKLAGTEIDIPMMAATTLTREKSGKLVEYKQPESLGSQQSPEVGRLMASLGTPLFSDKAVKPGDSWETTVDNPMVKDKKVTVKTTFVGMEAVEGKPHWKVKQTAEAVTDGVGGKLTYQSTYWLDPANGQETKSEITVKDLPSNFGLLTFDTKTARLKEEKTDK